jgi:hypothetical protein
MQLSFYLRPPMHDKRRQYGRIVFKLLLLAVYFVFFNVQLLLRYSSPRSLQFLESGSYRNLISNQSAGPKAITVHPIANKNESVCYLNKRYHPKDAVNVSIQEFKFEYFYAEISVRFCLDKEDISRLKTNTTPLRGPPAIC